jgi:hypothetical protein
MANIQLKSGDRAPNATVFTFAGQPTELSELWQAGPVVLAFLRHFG